MSQLIAAYLFLGGTGAGLFFWAAVLRLLGFAPDGYGLPYRRALAVSAGMLVLGCLCLFCDLGNPRVIFALFFPAHLNYMAVGAWALAALILCCGALLLLPPTRRGGRKAHSHGVLRVVGALLALYVMVYTGLLLKLAAGVDLWNSALLPVLFLCSALAAGFAAFSLCERVEDMPAARRRWVLTRSARLEVALVAVEAVVAAAFVADVGAQPFGAPALEVLFSGSTAALFVGGYCVLGLAAPLATEAVTCSGKTSEWPSVVGATAALFGAFCLRFTLVVAGVNVLF